MYCEGCHTRKISSYHKKNEKNTSKCSPLSTLKEEKIPKPTSWRWLQLERQLCLQMFSSKLKDRRRRPEGGGGGEWEPIKIPRRNLSYILESTRYPSLLARPRLASYRQANGPWNQLGTTAETRNGASKTSCEIDNKNQLEKQFICSQTFHRITGECELKSTL
jgi:hypothetical protein